ncbi:MULTISPECIES: PAS domain S-box protein [unclassified Haladaptatus]|uniref:PAS domain S-box protein n=1 Tax=unclassified Haladaptatus TaxID=2622732 RepID=UPI00209BFCA6|nr:MULTISPECIES: PAS domain S-box protein [unclassified Haladaptatus]MCO8245788.1 PAS domain S-box protein [Haladaptatus sp. AB643]MCO8256135.1 PAS domain S-box protein [Haladaptatus sp. AB618]
MSLHESYLDTPQIVYVGQSGRVGLQGATERRTSATKVLDRLDIADCVVCEQSPPERDAVAVLEEVRERDTELPFFIVTDDDRTITRALSSGVTDCVNPDRPELLTHRVERAINDYRTGQELEQATAILGGLADAVVTIDEEGRIRYANDGLERVLGYDPTEMLGRQLTTAIPSVLRSTHRKSFDRYVETGERQLDWEHVETIARHRDGHEVPVLLSFHNGMCGGDELITGIIRDVSERKAVETELEASRERYRRLVATSPEAVLVADAETGIIVDANGAAEELLGRPRNEICGMHQSEIHPVERREQYRQIFENHSEAEGIIRNVDHLSVVRPDGEEVPVEISANVSEVGDQRLVNAIFKDISDRKDRERTLEYLRSATRRLMTAETKTDICEIAVKAAGDKLDLPLSILHLTNEGGDELVPAAMTETTETLLDEIPRFEENDDPVWSAFESGEAVMFDGSDDGLEVCEEGMEVEQGIVIPLGAHGVFLLGSPSTGRFDEYVRDFAEILATNVQSALDRAEREETLATQRGELVELNRINEVIRDVDRTLVQATSREEIEETVVGRLASAGPYEFAWIGEYEMGVETVRAVANAGDDTYYESADKKAGQRNCPVAKALRSGQTVVVEDVPTDPAFESWVTEALDGDYQSLAALPIRYDETQYGVLVVHADREGAFDSREQSVLVELGETIGMAIAAMESRKALVSDCVVEVEMEALEADHYLIDIPQKLGCTFVLQGTTISPTGEILCFVTASGAPPEVIRERTEQYDGVTDTRVVHEREDECIFEVSYDGPSFVKALVDRGATLGHVEAGPEKARGTIELPRDADIRGMVEAVQRIAPTARVVAQREREKPEPTATEFRMQLAESLTDRQRTAMETAYLAGFFEWPRNSTGEEVAELLDVSAPTFHQHLRHAQSKVLKTFFDR